VIVAQRSHDDQQEIVPAEKVFACYEIPERI
jgi:hypothetical protein